jgi:hypothetical protein
MSDGPKSILPLDNPDLADEIESILERYDAKRRAEDAVEKELAARKEELTGRVSVAAIALTMLMSFLGFARAERQEASDNAKTDALQAKADSEADWAYYQTRSAERASYRLADETLLRDTARLAETDPRVRDAEVHHAQYATRISAIDHGNRRVFYSIQDLVRARVLKTREMKRLDTMIDRYDMGTRVLTLALVLLSVALLANRRSLFWIALAVALFGAAIAVAGYFSLF